MPTELTQTLINALLLLIVAFVGGTLGLRRFETLERSIAELRAELKGDITGFRDELKGDITGFRDELKGDITGHRGELKGELSELRAELGQMRSEMARMRSDLTLVALAVGARPGEAVEGHGG